MSDLKQNFRNLLQNTQPTIKKIKDQMDDGMGCNVTLTPEEGRRIVQFFVECGYVCSEIKEV